MFVPEHFSLLEATITRVVLVAVQCYVLQKHNYFCFVLEITF